MWNNLRTAPTNLLRRLEQFTQPKRTTFVLRRKYPVKLNQLGATFPKKLRRRNFYYELVENRNFKKQAPLELVLTADVPGIGMRGEKVEMNVFIAYRDLLLPKLALYADSPEAEKVMKAKEEKEYSSKYSKFVGNYLAVHPVQIILSNDVNWTLKPWHVKLALRKNGIITDEGCISIPKEISGPNEEIENKDFIVHVTMNKWEVFPIRCRIYHWSTVEPAQNQKSFDVFSQSEALFPEEKETIDAMIKVEQDIKRSKMLRGENTKMKKKGR